MGGLGVDSGQDSWVISIEVFQGPLDVPVGFFPVEVLVEWEWVLWLSVWTILVSEAPGFEAVAVWLLETDLQQVVIDVCLLL